MREVLLLCSIVVLNTAAARPARTYVHPDCGYSFRIPAGSRVKAVTDDPQGHCEVVVRPNGNDGDNVAVWVEGGEGDFNVAARAANLDAFTDSAHSKAKPPFPPVGAYIGLQADGTWKEARRFTRGALSGLRIDDVVVACHPGDTGTDRCPIDVAILSTGHKFAVVTGPPWSSTFESILATLSVPLPVFKTYVNAVAATHSATSPAGSWRRTRKVAN